MNRLAEDKALKSCKKRNPHLLSSLKKKGEGKKLSQRLPTLPAPFEASTIGLRGLNDRIRNGNGCGPSSMTTENKKDDNLERGSKTFYYDNFSAA